MKRADFFALGFIFFVIITLTKGLGYAVFVFSLAFGVLVFGRMGAFIFSIMTNDKWSLRQNIGLLLNHYIMNGKLLFDVFIVSFLICIALFLVKFNWIQI